MLPLIAAIGAAASGVAGSIVNFNAQRDAASLTRQRTAEEVRRFRLEANQRLGQSAALAGASGVAGTSLSVQNYLAGNAAEYQRQEDFMQRMGDAEANARRRQANWGLASGLMGGGFSFGQSQNWWQK